MFDYPVFKISSYSIFPLFIDMAGKTVVFVTHDPEEAKEMGAEILVL